MNLAHAVVTADFLDYTSPLLPGLGFLLQSYEIIDWTNPDLCLNKDGANKLSDVAHSALCARIG